MDTSDVLRAALADLKAVSVDPVAAGEVFFVRDLRNVAHFLGECTSEFIPGHPYVWESIGGSDLANLDMRCECTVRSYRLPSYVSWVDFYVRNGFTPVGSAKWGSDHPVNAQAFPGVYEVWDRVHRLLVDVMIAAEEDDFPKYVCTVQRRVLPCLERYPDGTSATHSWVEDVRSAIRLLCAYGDYFELVDVAGWPVERVKVVSALIREAGSKAEALVGFKLAEQLVPALT